jgi:small GTP-binding protein
MAGQRVDLQLNDTAGQEDYDRLRPVSYPNTDVFLLCFSLDDVENTRNVREKWHPELKDYSPDVHVVLVGTKSDLRLPATDSSCCCDTARDDSPTMQQRRRRRQITTEEGECLAREIGAIGYVECSAKRHENVQEVFALAASAALIHGNPSLVTSLLPFAASAPSKTKCGSSRRGAVSQGGSGSSSYYGGALDTLDNRPPLTKLCGDLDNNVKSLMGKKQQQKKVVKCYPTCSVQ